MFLLKRESSLKDAPFAVDCLFHGRAIPDQFREGTDQFSKKTSSPLQIEYAKGEGLDMLYGSLGQTLGPRFADILNEFAALLDAHPQDSVIKLNVDERLDWLWNTYPPSEAFEMVYRAFEFYRNVFETFCPEIFPVFFSMLETEAVLYAKPNPKAYREHLAHPVYVFLAGRRILDCPTNLEEIADRTFARLANYEDFLKNLPDRLPMRKKVDKDCTEEKDSKEKWEEALDALMKDGDRQQRVVLLAWMITGLCHDLGYPTWHAAEQASKVKNDSMPVQVKSEWAGSPELTEFVKDSLFFCELRRRHMDYKKSEDLTSEVAKGVVKNHSFASALTVLSTLRTLLERCQWALSIDRKADRILDFAVAWELAAEAIALHDADSPKKAGNVRTPVALSTNPLAWLLRTMDLIQEWDRPVHWAGKFGDDYLIPFEAVAVRVVKNSDGKHRAVRIYRLLNRELLDADGKRISKNVPLCPAHWPGYWSDFEARVPEPQWGWGVGAILQPFANITGMEQLYALNCRGNRLKNDNDVLVHAGDPAIHDPDSLIRRSPDYFYENNADECRAHSRCMHNFWAQDVESYLNTGSNAENLGRMLTQLSRTV